MLRLCCLEKRQRFELTVKDGRQEVDLKKKLPTYRGFSKTTLSDLGVSEEDTKLESI